MSLSVIHLNFSYPNAKVPAVDDLSYTFKPGKFYGIFGANGSGKSTLLKLLAGDLSGDAAVLLEGRVLRSFNCKERAKLLAYAAQEDELIMPFKVKDCIALGRYVWNDENNALIARLLKDWNAESLQDKPFAELSGGERQKIKLLRILAQDTRYILLDEPASSLDLPKQLELYENLQKVAHEENKCIIMVCHDLYIAPTFIDEMLIMKTGKLLYTGLPATTEAAEATSEAFGREITITRKSRYIEVSW